MPLNNPNNMFSLYPAASHATIAYPVGIRGIGIYPFQFDQPEPISAGYLSLTICLAPLFGESTINDNTMIFTSQITGTPTAISINLLGASTNNPNLSVVVFNSTNVNGETAQTAIANYRYWWIYVASITETDDAPVSAIITLARGC